MNGTDKRKFFEILSELRDLVESGNIPYQQKIIIGEQIDILNALLWSWST